MKKKVSKRSLEELHHSTKTHEVFKRSLSTVPVRWKTFYQNVAYKTELSPETAFIIVFNRL